jgi:Trk K+ transport system NAD-binding subunit
MLAVVGAGFRRAERFGTVDTIGRVSIAQPATEAEPATGTGVAAAAARRFVVCGGDALALRLAEELTTRYEGEVVVVLPSARSGHGPRIAELPGVSLVEAGQVDARALRQAGIGRAAAVALVAQDDAGNVDLALLARELNPSIRVVLRMFNMNLGAGVRELLGDCEVLSTSEIAAPAFVAAALDERAPTYIDVSGHTLVVARRQDVRPEDVVCGLAVTGGDEPETLPVEQQRADIVLATSPAPAPQVSTRRASRHPIRAMYLLISRRVGYVFAALAVVLLAASAILVADTHMAAWPAFYFALVTTLGGADPNLGSSASQQVLHAVLTVVGIVFMPILTATVVEAMVNARLARASGALIDQPSGHIVVVGLGNVGTRVIQALHGRGCQVVAIDQDEQARGVQTARQLGVRVVIADASNQGTLRSAGVEQCRSVVVLSTDDVTNLETALLARSIKPNVPVVLRLFDGEFADRVQRAFAINVSRSVSYLAAPSFAAAMLGRHAIDSIPIQRRVLLVAEIPVAAHSPIEGLPASELRLGPGIRLIGVRTGNRRQILWSPLRGRKFTHTDRLIVVATRAGLSEIINLASPPGASAT